MKQENSEIGKKVITDGLDLCLVLTEKFWTLQSPGRPITMGAFSTGQWKITQNRWSTA